MLLGDYFDFLKDETIRIRGTRVGIETVVQAYQSGASPEEILIRYPTLTLQQVHATITYFLAHQSDIESYVRRVWEQQEADWQEQQRAETPFLRDLRERIDRQRHLGKTDERQRTIS
jgi:uncharacterized protein (DUF433 family)